MEAGAALVRTADRAVAVETAEELRAAVAAAERAAGDRCVQAGAPPTHRPAMMWPRRGSTHPPSLSRHPC